MKKMLKAILAGSVALAPLAAFAAIDTTHHDMTATGVAIGTTEKCAYCHSKTLGANDATYGKVGGFCVQVCHIANSGPANGGRGQVVPDNAEFYTFTEATSTVDFTAIPGLAPDALRDGHQFSAARLVTVCGEANQTTMTGTNWPHLAVGGTLECTSCHAVHDNTNPPFLNDDYVAFCERCHTNKSGNYGTTVTGNHPTAMQFDAVTALAYDGTDAKNPEAATLMNARTLRYPASAAGASPANLYDGFTSVVVGATPQATANDVGTSWELSGHVLHTAGAGTTGLPVEGVGDGNATPNRFGCYSCHNAHQDNPTGGLNEPLVAPRTLISTNVLTLGGAVADTSDACYGCHGYDAVDNDPGASGLGHPINNETVISDTYGWVVPVTAAGTPATGPEADAYDADGTPKCLACHDVHNGVTTGLMSLRNSAPANGSACNACHVQSFAPGAVGGINGANAHHPGRNAVDYTAVGNGSFANLSIPAGAKIAWGTVDNNGNLADGLSCPDCHVGDGTATKRTTAHNW